MLVLLLACSRSPGAPDQVPERPYVQRHEPSFNCDRATTPVEHAICSSQDLADLDSALLYTYTDLKEVRQDVAADEVRWLHERDACGSTADIRACVHNAYVDRLLEIGPLVNPLIGFFSRGTLDVDSDEFQGLSVAIILPDRNNNLSMSGWSVGSNGGRSSCSVELQTQVLGQETIAATMDDESICIARLITTPTGVHIDASHGCGSYYCGQGATWGGELRRVTDPVERRRWEQE